MTEQEKSKFREKCRKFWNKDKTDSPIIGCLFNRMAPLSYFTNNYKEGKITPGDVSIKVFLDDCRRRHSASEKLLGDSIFVAYPYIGLPWLDAVMGAKVHVGGGSAWAVADVDWKNYSEDSVEWENGWYDLMLAQTKAAIGDSDGTYPVGPSHLRGIGDVIADMIGQAEFCIALYDKPEKIRELITITTDVWRSCVDAMYEILPPDNNGYWNGNQPLWCPGKTMFVPADLVSLISRDMFKDFFIGPLEGMMKDLDYSIMHTHSNYLHALEDCLHIDELKAVQIGIDPGGPSVDELVPLLRKVMEKKSIIIAEPGNFSMKELGKLIKSLPQEGLCVLLYRETVEECNEAYANLQRELS